MDKNVGPSASSEGSVDQMVSKSLAAILVIMFAMVVLTVYQVLELTRVSRQHGLDIHHLNQELTPGPSIFRRVKHLQWKIDHREANEDCARLNVLFEDADYRADAFNSTCRSRGRPNISVADINKTIKLYKEFTRD